MSNWKTHSTDAPYCRHAEWWKSVDDQSSEEGVGKKYIEKRPRYRLRKKGKTWSLMVLKSRSAGLEDEFNKLVEQWKQDTFSISSLTKIYAHPAYQRIMAMGTDGIPLLLKELQNNQGHWFYALKFMAGTNVSEGMNNFEDAKAAWLEWGYNNNYI